MPKLLQINTVATICSTGKIAEEIGRQAIADGWESWIAYGRGNPKSQSNLIKIGNGFDMMWHGLQTRLFDRHGLASKKATKTFIKEIKKINPDLIHLHNIHGYYLNYPLLFRFLEEWGGPVVWTFHDCWPFTGHCTHFENYGCKRWISGCYGCPAKKEYPKSGLIDQSKRNYSEKKSCFLSLKNLTIITPSAWLKEHVKSSFLADYDCFVFTNGIDTEVFSPCHRVQDNKKTVLAVASTWTESKGTGDLRKLNDILPEDYKLVVAGITDKQKKHLPKGISGITRTEDQKELAKLYSEASVFVNPTYGDTFPTTNLEALACGTPVVTYQTGGSPEAIDKDTGRVVEKGDINGLCNAILYLESLPQEALSNACRKRAVRLFDQKDRFAEYISLYNSLLDR